MKIVITVLNIAESHMTGGNTVNSEDSNNCTEHSRIPILLKATLETVKIVITILNTAKSYMTRGNTVNQ